MDRLGSLTAFMQAAEARSFATAGRQLGISSSAVGKAIARLEARLGVRLFHRSTRVVTLTPEGRLFLERCRKIVCEVEQAELELSRTRDAPRGKLRVSLPMVGRLMVPTLSAFMETWPEIELDLDFTDRLVDVIDEGFDAVIRTGEARDSRLMTRVLGSYDLRLVGAPAYFAAHGIPKSPRDLAGHRCLRHRFPTTGRLEDWLPEADDAIDLRTAATSNTIEPLVCLAERGLGIACLPDFAVRAQIEAGTLIIVLDGAARRCGTFRILWPSSRQLAPKIRVFVDFMAENLFAPPSRTRSEAAVLDDLPEVTSGSSASRATIAEASTNISGSPTSRRHPPAEAASGRPRQA